MIKSQFKSKRQRGSRFLPRRVRNRSQGTRRRRRFITRIEYARELVYLYVYMCTRSRVGEKSAAAETHITQRQQCTARLRAHVREISAILRAGNNKRSRALSFSRVISAATAVPHLRTTCALLQVYT